MRSWTVVGVLSILLLSTSFPIFIASAQEPVRSLGIEQLDYMTPELVVTSDKDATAYFETIVSVYDTVDETGIVEFQVTNDMDWPISISPESFNFTKPVTQKVNISVSVPAGTDASEIAVVKLKGYAIFPGETVFSSVSGYLELKQIFNFSVSYSYIKRAAMETWVQINIVNKGNGRDRIMALLLDGDMLNDADIHVTMSHMSNNLPMNSTLTQEVHCKYEGTVYPKKFDLRIQVLSIMKGHQEILVIPLSFKGPDPPIQPNVFAGVIVAFVIVIVIILAVVLRGPSKTPK